MFLHSAHVCEWLWRHRQYSFGGLRIYFSEGVNLQTETLQMLRVHCIPMFLFLPSPFWARLLNSGLLQNPSILFFSKPCLLFILLSWLIFSISLLLLTPFPNFKLLKWNKILSGHSRTFLLYIHFFSFSISLLLDQYCPIRCSSVMKMFYQFSSVQFSCSVVSDSLRPHGLQHSRPPCLSATLRQADENCFTKTMSVIQADVQ